MAIYYIFFHFQASPTDNGLLLDEDSMRSEDGVLSPEDSDLAQLRSLNDTELSADWYNFQVITSNDFIAGNGICKVYFCINIFLIIHDYPFL